MSVNLNSSDHRGIRTLGPRNHLLLPLLSRAHLQSYIYEDRWTFFVVMEGLIGCPYRYIVQGRGKGQQLSVSQSQWQADRKRSKIASIQCQALRGLLHEALQLQLMVQLLVLVQR